MEMQEEKVEFKLEDLYFKGGILNFKIIKYTSRDVPIRYQTVNYQKFPVEWKKSTRTAVFKNYHKHIDVKRFCEIELKDMDIDESFKDEIINFLSYTPTWKRKQLDIADKKAKFMELRSKIKPLINLDNEINKIKKDFNKRLLEINNKKASLKITKSSKTSFILRIIFSIFTFGLSWIGYVSDKKAKDNMKKYLSYGEQAYKLNVELVKTLQLTTSLIKQKNLEIAKQNEAYRSQMRILKEEARKIHNSDYTSDCCENDFINLRKKLPTVQKFNCKGVYVIWNKTKNKYYVGQSKDIYKRLFTQHFNNCDVKNIIFAKDWYNGDDFYYKIIECSTKDELDLKEKELIEKYDSFRNGYNGTGGNS